MIILAALVLSFLVSTLFVRYQPGSMTTLITFFILLFMAAIASQLWFVPIGPSFYGVYWLPMIGAVILFAILFSVPPKLMKKKSNGEEQDNAPIVAISLFTWLLFAMLMLSIAIGLYKQGYFLLTW